MSRNLESAPLPGASARRMQGFDEARDDVLDIPEAGRDITPNLVGVTRTVESVPKGLQPGQSVDALDLYVPDPGAHPLTADPNAVCDHEEVTTLSDRRGDRRRLGRGMLCPMRRDPDRPERIDGLDLKRDEWRGRERLA